MIPILGSFSAASRRVRATKRAAGTAPKLLPTCKRCGGKSLTENTSFARTVYLRTSASNTERHLGSGLRAIEQAKQQGHDPTHGETAAERRAKTNVRRKREAREWDERYGKLTDLSAFEREILPAIQGVPLSRLQRATGLSLRYVSLIRRGEKTPHPRHWQRLLGAAEEHNV